MRREDSRWEMRVWAAERAVWRAVVVGRVGSSDGEWSRARDEGSGGWSWAGVTATVGWRVSEQEDRATGWMV